MLIKDMVQAIPSYIISILNLPKSFCASLITVVVRFWWTSSRKHRGIHWTNVEVLCSPKNLGGLGFRKVLCSPKP